MPRRDSEPSTPRSFSAVKRSREGFGHDVDRFPPAAMALAMISSAPYTSRRYRDASCRDRFRAARPYAALRSFRESARALTMTGGFARSIELTFSIAVSWRKTRRTGIERLSAHASIRIGIGPRCQPRRGVATTLSGVANGTFPARRAPPFDLASIRRVATAHDTPSESRAEGGRAFVFAFADRALRRPIPQHKQVGRFGLSSWGQSPRYFLGWQPHGVPRGFLRARREIAPSAIAQSVLSRTCSEPRGRV